MKIEYRKGDLFQTEIETILHGCNAQGVMGSGVAKIVREKYKEAYATYRNDWEHCIGLELPLGVISCAHSNGKLIVNAITQQYYGRDGKRYVSYDAVSDCMRKVNTSLVPLFKVEPVIAMPQIGAGLGGGDWNVIEAIIESELTNIQPVVYLL